jgi:hypothetical protein
MYKKRFILQATQLGRETITMDLYVKTFIQREDRKKRDALVHGQLS